LKCCSVSTRPWPVDHLSCSTYTYRISVLPSDYYSLWIRMKGPRVAFFGTPILAKTCLAALHKAFEVVLVVTNPDRECGRGKRARPNPVKEYALEHGINVYHETEGGLNLVSILRSEGVELNVVVAYGRILQGEIIEGPAFGSVNLHASLLPKYRGPSPIAAAILNGEKKTGVTLQKMHRRMDAGAVIVQLEIQIGEHDTASDLLDKVMEVSPAFIVDGIQKFITGAVRPRPQDEASATYCALIRKQDGLINWGSRSERIVNEIRAYNPWPVAYTFLDGKHLRIYRAVKCEESFPTSARPGEIVDLRRGDGIVTVTGDGTIGILDLQLENKRKMGYREFACGCRELVGKVLKKQR
jgi:methionyl-tRNA formyltransferase